LLCSVAGGRVTFRLIECLSPPGACSKYEVGQSLCGMMLPKKLRMAHTVLRAVNIETARVADQVSGELQGRMRLLWWKEAVEAATHSRGGPAALPQAYHAPVVLALAALAKHHPTLDPSLLDRLIDARIAELDPTQPQEVYSLEKYAEDTQSTLLYALLQCAGYDQAIDPDVAASALPFPSILLRWTQFSRSTCTVPRTGLSRCITHR
jgi:NADH dehydrogenase [ubiquinone] 1 alpha subcomplex assembly factor 6